MASKYRQEYRKEEIGIQGLEYFGHCIFPEAAAPICTHTHPQCVEIVLVTKGTEYYVADGGSYAVTRGRAFVAYEGQPHRSGEPCQNVSEILWFQVNTEQTGEFLGLSEDYGKELQRAVKGIQQHIIPVADECLAAAKKCAWALAHNLNRVYTASLFASMLAQLVFLGENRHGADAAVERVMDYVERNIRENISLEAMCGQLGFSLSALQHKFRQATGYSLRGYINYRKIMLAKELLMKTGSVTGTAMELGFSSSDYFSTVFKKYTHQTPTQYMGNAEASLQDGGGLSRLPSRFIG